MNILRRQSVQVVIMSLLIGTILFGLAEAVTFFKSEQFEGLGLEERNAIKLVLKDKQVKDFVNVHPDWWASAYADNETEWHVDFYYPSEYADEEWIGHAHVNIKDGTVFDTFLPRDPSPEEFEIASNAIKNLVFADAEVLARLGDVMYWDSEIYYDKYQNIWRMEFWQGISSLAVQLDSYQDGDKEVYEIAKIYDPKDFEDSEAVQVKQNQAIELAYESEQIDAALSGVQNWHTYVEQQDDAVYGVSFTDDKDTLFYVLVNIDDWEILSEARANPEN